MNEGWYVTANDINYWTQTNKRRAEEILPKLIRRLITAMVTPDLISIPYGDSINKSGYDAIVENKEKSLYVPIGKSLWEFGTDSKINDKANCEYDKRSRQNTLFQKSKTYFIFTTTRTWNKKNDWVLEKNHLKKWKKVIGYNADDLAVWLQECPAVHRWFAKLIGKRTDNVWDIEQAWDAFRNKSTPQITSDFVLYGHEAQSKQFSELLNVTDGKIIQILSNSRVEAYNFALSAIMANSNLISRTLIIKCQENWDKLLENQHPMILIPYGFFPENIGLAESKNHQVVLIENPNSRIHCSQIDITNYIGSKREEALEKLGLSKDHAKKIYKDTHGYLAPILRHPLMKPKEAATGEWLKPEFTNSLIAAFFAGTWNNTNNKDKNCLSNLSGVSYEIFTENMNKIIAMPDPPIRKIGEIWQVISKIDLWHFLSEKIAESHLQKLEAEIHMVIGETNPACELSPDKRWLANVYGNNPEYSAPLKLGLSNTLALLGAWGHQMTNYTTGNVSDLIQKWIRDLFNANNHKKGWYSLNTSLKFLAEAAPNIFLEAIEKGISGDDPPIADLFLSEGFYGSSNHVYIIWALELSALDKHCFTRAVKILAQLDSFHKNPKQGNTPMETLRELFLGWVNYTVLSFEEKLTVLRDILAKQYPDIAFLLMQKLLFKFHDTASFNTKPEYRNWMDDSQKSVNRDDYVKYVSNIADYLLEIVKEQPESRCIEIVDKIDEIPHYKIPAFSDWLIQWGKQEIPEPIREDICKTLDSKIRRHREFPDADWTMDEKYIQNLEAAKKHLEPKSTYYTYKWLFDDYYPQFFRKRFLEFNNYLRQEKYIQKIRTLAINKIFAETGFKGIEKLVLESKASGTLGQACGYSKHRNQWNEKLLGWLDAKNPQKSIASKNYVFVRFKTDHNWFESHLQSLKKWPTLKSANFLLSLPTTNVLFDILKNIDKKISNEYWKNVPRIFIDDQDLPEADGIIQNLLANNRPEIAIELVTGLIHLKKNKISLNNILLAQALTLYVDLQNQKTENSLNDPLAVIQYLQEENKLPPDQIALIEWKYLTFFQYSNSKPIFLSKEIYNNPGFFVYIVKMTHLRDDGSFEQDIDEKSASFFGHQYFTLMRVLKGIPGQQGDGNIDTDKLNQWVAETRNLFKEIGRINIGDDQIGTILSKSPKGSDGILLHESVRNLIEHIRSEKMDNAINCGIVNSFGVTTRSMECGGSIERNRAIEYKNMATLISLKWPRTATIFQSIARSQEQWAKREDYERDLRQ